MQRAKVNQQRVWPAERPESTINRNWFEGLSHRWVATFTMGKLVPFLKIPTFPNDFFKIDVECMLRFAPLYLPIMHRVNLSMDFHFVPNRIIWKYSLIDIEDAGVDYTLNWENFLMNKQDGLIVPSCQFSASELLVNPTTGISEVPMYMGAPSAVEILASTDYLISINALPLVAYYMIYDQYYRNDQIQAPVQAENDLHNGDVETIFTNPTAQTLNCFYRNWNRDLFTVCTPAPAAGIVQIPLVTDDFGTNGTDPRLPTKWYKLSDGTEAGSGLLTYSDVDDATKDAGGFQIGLDIQATAASIQQFRFASVYAEYLERVMRTGDKISDYYPNFWDTDPYNGTLQLPQFLGTKNGKVVVSEVMSTTETATLKVGNYAGQALALEATNGTIEYHCLEHGYIIGIISVYPDSSYFQGLERDWTKSTYLDFADPRFALVGDEEVLNKEVAYDFFTANAAWNNEVFGYRERFLDSRFKNDVVAGLMRTTLNSFHLARIFDPNFLDEEVVLADEFLQCRPRVTDVFQVTEGEDEIYCHIYNHIRVQRMLPKFGIPRL